MSESSPPLVLCGPMLRQVSTDRVVIWLAVREPVSARLELTADGRALDEPELELSTLRAAEHLTYMLISAKPAQALPDDAWIRYRLALKAEGADEWLDHRAYAPDLCYPGLEAPMFRVPSRLHAVLHGSCRKPHHDGPDGLAAIDRRLADRLARDAEGTERESGQADHREAAWPDLLIMSGDQVYIDDVAGPMLAATHALSKRLGFAEERLASADLSGLDVSSDLYADPDGFYQRDRLLPKSARPIAMVETLFGGAQKPVFTSVNAGNHLITLAEMFCMYLLVWSPACWQDLAVSPPASLSDELSDRFEREGRVIRSFVAGLAAVRRVMAHVPVAMIFDDHDVSDDWNLNRAWEELVYEHPFSRRMVGNALLAYLIHQGWGNAPEAFSAALIANVQAALDAPGSERHDEAVDEILDFEGWDYTWESSPPLIVLDTRTRRWRSERRANKPSGLLDWEAITDLQRRLRDRDAVLLVSAAPIFGVKLIESVQKVFTWLGKPLMVDAEYWLAHAGTADGMLNVFSHRKTPKNFVVLSGDVHYSFVYDIELRGRRTPDSDIWQICSSGLKNEFPERLLDVLDVGNRWLYSPRSPLNWFTRRRRMRIIPRKPNQARRGHRLLNGVGFGLVELDDDGAPWRISQVLAATDEAVSFHREESHAHWD